MKNSLHLSVIILRQTHYLDFLEMVLRSPITMGDFEERSENQKNLYTIPIHAKQLHGKKM